MQFSSIMVTWRSHVSSRCSSISLVPLVVAHWIQSGNTIRTMRKVEPWMVWQIDWHSFDDGSFSPGRYREDRSPLSCHCTRRNWNDNNIQFKCKSMRVKYVHHVVISSSSHDVTTSVVVESTIARVTTLETVFHRGHVSQIIDFHTTRRCFVFIRNINQRTRQNTYWSVPARQNSSGWSGLICRVRRRFFDISKRSEIAALEEMVVSSLHDPSGIWTSYPARISSRMTSPLSSQMSNVCSDR